MQKPASSEEADPAGMTFDRRDNVPRSKPRRPLHLRPRRMRIRSKQQVDDDPAPLQRSKRPIRCRAILTISPRDGRSPTSYLRAPRSRTARAGMHFASADMPAQVLLEPHRGECVRARGRQGGSRTDQRQERQWGIHIFEVTGQQVPEVLGWTSNCSAGVRS